MIQTRMPMATSNQGEKRKCRAKPTTVRATMAMRARAMIKGTVIGLRSRWVDCVPRQGSGPGGRPPGSSVMIAHPVSDVRCSCLNFAAAVAAGRSGLAPAQPWFRGGRHQGEPRSRSQLERSSVGDDGPSGRTRRRSAAARRHLSRRHLSRRPARRSAGVLAIARTLSIGRGLEGE